MLDDHFSLDHWELWEWANPNEKEYYIYMKSYIALWQLYRGKFQPNYVGYYRIARFSKCNIWNRAKMDAKLREYKTDNNLLRSIFNMDASHGGASAAWVPKRGG